MPPKQPETPEQAAEKLERHRLLNRERQRKWYSNQVNKNNLLEKRKEERKVYREYKKGTLHNARTPPQEEQEEPQDNEVYYDAEEEPRPQPPPREPTVEKLTTMPEADILKIRKVPCSSKQNFDSIVEQIRERINASKKQSQATLNNYIAVLGLLYRATDTPKEKAINLNNPQRLFLQLDNCLTSGKTPRPYAFSSKTNWIQMIVLLADPRNDFKLGVKTEAFQEYDTKLKALQILGQERAEKKTTDVDIYSTVPTFTKIVELAEAKFGKESKFYLLLRVYSAMKARDNFDLVIVRSENEARDAKTNYIVIPPLRATRLGNQSPIANVPGKVILKNYKTSATYGVITSNLDSQTLKLTRDYMERNKIEYGQYLFGPKSQSKYVRDCLREIGITVKNQNVGILRHSILSEARNKGLTAQEEASLTKSMGHNPATSKLYSRKMKAD